jgi:hypothetical protein
MPKHAREDGELRPELPGSMVGIQPFANIVGLPDVKRDIAAFSLCRSI